MNTNIIEETLNITFRFELTFTLPWKLKSVWTVPHLPILHYTIILFWCSPICESWCFLLIIFSMISICLSSLSVSPVLFLLVFWHSSLCYYLLTTFLTHSLSVCHFHWQTFSTSLSGSVLILSFSLLTLSLYILYIYICLFLTLYICIPLCLSLPKYLCLSLHFYLSLYISLSLYVFIYP